MTIKKIEVSNFRSYNKLEIEFNNFNVLIGGNASGKSNFLQIFKFLRDIFTHGLKNAISMQGIEYLTNIKTGANRNLKIKIVFEPHISSIVTYKDRYYGLVAHRVTNDFSIKFQKDKRSYHVIKDKLSIDINVESLKEGKEAGFLETDESIGDSFIVISNTNGEVKRTFTPSEKVPFSKEDIFPSFFKDTPDTSSLLLINQFYSLPFPSFARYFRNISIFDIDVKLPKKSVPITGKTELEEDGSNLAIVLRDILDDDEKRRKFTNLVNELLPFIRKLDIEKFADKSMYFKCLEKYSSKKYLPASLLSDGTINLVALIIILYFGGKKLKIIEEPGRTIHPHLISKLIEMFKEASEENQIIITTHNPEIVKHVDIENLLLISRDKKGFSNISKVSKKDDLNEFLQNEIGIDELFIQNLLEE